MKREKLYKDENLLLEYIEEGKYLHETWWGHTPHEVFMKHLDLIIKILEEKEADGLLLDACEHKGLEPKDQRIAAKRISEYRHKHGRLKQAIIVPKNVFSKFSVENFGKIIDEESKNEIKYFTNTQEAESWLKEK